MVDWNSKHIIMIKGNLVFIVIKLKYQKNGQSPRVRPTDGSDESLKLEIARILKPMSLVR